MSQQPKTDKTSDMKRIVLTGGTGVIGAAIAKKLVSNPNIELHLLARNSKKLENLINNKLNKYVNKTSEIKSHIVDLNSSKSINDFISNFNKNYETLNVLINNAAITTKTKQLNEDGIETMFAVNVLSYFKLMNGLYPLLKNESSFTRIVNVASNYSGGLKISDLEFNNRSFDCNSAYKQSKLCNRMLSKYASNLWLNDNIGVYSCHPGVVKSNVLTGLGFGSGWDSASQSADTPYFIAVSNKVTLKQSGYFYNNCRGSKDSKTTNDKLNKQLWDICQKYD